MKMPMPMPMTFTSQLFAYIQSRTFGIAVFARFRTSRYDTIESEGRSKSVFPRGDRLTRCMNLSS
jgi:hypothetical protein